MRIEARAGSSRSMSVLIVCQKPHGPACIRSATSSGDPSMLTKVTAGVITITLSSSDATTGSLAAMWRIVLTRACVLVRVRTEPARRRAAHVVEELLETTPVRGVPAGALDQMERWRAQTESARSRSCSTRARCRAFG